MEIIERLRASFAAKTARYFRLAASAKTQPQMNAAHAAESVAARAGVRLDAALAQKAADRALSELAPAVAIADE
jgi:hypothetical protein